MQMLDVIMYSQNSAAAGGGCGQTEKPKNKETFSDVLEQQVSQGKTNGESAMQPEERPVEAKPDELPAETQPEIQNLAALLWLNQNPLVVQKPMADAGAGQTMDVITEAVPLVEEPQAPQQPMIGETTELLPTEAKTPELNLSKTDAEANGIPVNEAPAAELPTGKEAPLPVELSDEALQKTKPIELTQGDKTANEEASVKNASHAETAVKADSTEQAPNDNNTAAGQGEKKDADIVPNHQPVTASEQKVFSESVKTAPTAGPEIPQSKADLPSLAQTIMDQVEKGKKEFEIWLQPANLGKMAIKVAYEGGKAAISILCTNEKTMELISQNAKNLGTILEQHTGTQTVVVIDKPESDYLQQQTEQQNRDGNQQQENQPDQSEKENETESLSFLQQLRLGLA